jgi:hypothetical protein
MNNCMCSRCEANSLKLIGDEICRPNSAQLVELLVFPLKFVKKFEIEPQIYRPIPSYYKPGPFYRNIGL